MLGLLKRSFCTGHRIIQGVSLASRSSQFQNVPKVSGRVYLSVKPSTDIETKDAANSGTGSSLYNDNAYENSGAGERGQQGGLLGGTEEVLKYFVVMKGIPYWSKENDVCHFFSPLRPVQVNFIPLPDGRPSGDCTVEFACHKDAQAAMAKDRDYMGQRYVSLSLKAAPSTGNHSSVSNGDAYGKSAKGDGDRQGGLPGEAHKVSGHSIRMRGLPYEASENDVYEFFSPLKPVKVNLIVRANGRATGNCRVEFASHEEAQGAIAKDKNYMGGRYVLLSLNTSQSTGTDSSVYNVNETGNREGGDMARQVGLPGGTREVSGHYIRMKGLPYDASENDVYDFFSPITPVKADLILSADGRPSGHCVVEFASEKEAQGAMTKNRNYLGIRYVELSRQFSPSTGNGSSVNKDNVNENSEAGDRERQGTLSGEHHEILSRYIHMHGLPYGASKEDVCDFFAPLKPLSVNFTAMANGLPSGNCSVEFASHDEARTALEKDNEYLGRRYVKLRLKTSPSTGNDKKYNNMEGANSGQQGGLLAEGLKVSGHFVHMRGLPYTAKENDIYDFFSPLKPIKVNLFMTNGRSTGSCDVEFASPKEVQDAMAKNNAYMGSRYVELFLKSNTSSLREF